MAEYNVKTSVGGKFLKPENVSNGVKITIVSEVKPMESSFKDKNGNPKMQNVGKIKVGEQLDSFNANFNRATLNALVKEFGSDSKEWVGEVLTVHTEKIRVGGKSQTAIYFVPDGYEVSDDENGYAVVSKIGDESETVVSESDQEVPF